MALEFPVRSPFIDWMGLELVQLSADETVITLDLRPEHVNTWGVAHGGVVMTLLDVVMANAARDPDVDPDARVGLPGSTVRRPPGVVTVEMKTSFMRPGVGPLRAVGRLVHRTASLAFCEGQVFDGEGRVSAGASGTFKYIRALPVGSKRVQRPGGSD